MLLDRLRQRLRDRGAATLIRERATLFGPSGRTVLRGRGSETASARPLLNFASNDYLGLANHPDIVAAFHQGLERYGAGAGASAMVSGHSAAHEELEWAIRDWVAPLFPDCRCLLFSNGYLANLALLTSLGERGDGLFCDKLNHASLIDGMRLSEADHRRYPHADLTALERQLDASRAPFKLIVTDGVFSMDGDIAPLSGLIDLAERFDAFVVVDDAHGMGVLGDEGRGSLALAQVCSERVILMGTLGKAAGVSGAFVAAHPTVIEWMQQTARSFIYTTAPPPAASHALLESLRVIRGKEGSSRRDRLGGLILQLQAEAGAFEGLGVHLLHSMTAIQPLVVGENRAARALASMLEKRGIWVPAIRPPTVPEGTARLRISLSAAHQENDVSQLCSLLRSTLEGVAPKD